MHNNKGEFLFLGVVSASYVIDALDLMANLTTKSVLPKRVKPKDKYFIVTFKSFWFVEQTDRLVGQVGFHYVPN